MNRTLKPKKPFHVSDPNFCDGCGAMLPQIPEVGDIQCLNCKKMIPVDDFEAVETTYTIWFNKLENEGHGKRSKKKGANKENEAEGPTVERMCPKCGYDKMSYATLQLRSADEGQTVFFTCLKCKFKESENS